MKVKIEHSRYRTVIDVNDIRYIKENGLLYKTDPTDRNVPKWLRLTNNKKDWELIERLLKLEGL